MIRRPPRSTRTDSFPTRRSSDLFLDDRDGESVPAHDGQADEPDVEFARFERVGDAGAGHLGEVEVGEGIRSEEHTSELQSLMRISYAVFCLKKKKKKVSQLLHKII